MSVTDELACSEIVELVNGYLDGELPEDLRAAVEAHMARCDGCDAVLAQFRATIRLTGALTEEHLTPAQRDTLREAFRGWRAGP